MPGDKPLDLEQISDVRDFIMFLGEKFKNSTENFEDFSKCSIQEITVLKILSQRGPLVVKEIARRLNNISLSSLTRVLDRLEDQGYITRTLNREDRRSFRIELTSEGNKLAEAYQHKFELMAEGVLQALTPAERLILVELYAKVRAHLGDTDISLTLSPDENRAAGFRTEEATPAF
ncbi:MAG TPA: MarR family transcriptional regulator [Chloroflexia bacterium]|nr:MarR family transcriptional regulator [Chloroflexia bacterium]